MDLLRWVVCLLVGHPRTEWVPAVWVQTTTTGVIGEPTWTTNIPEEIRFCRRCHSGYQHRYVL